MNGNRFPLEKEEPKYKKKSKKKGRPRADHKHEYKHVLLHEYMDNPFKPGIKNEYRREVEVCVLCGRIGKTIKSFFFEFENVKYDNTLEKWYVEDCFDKFAKKMEET